MKGQKPLGRELGQAWRYDSLGYTFAFSVILFAGVGWVLDRWLDIRPVLTVSGTLIGAGMAFVWVYLKVRQDEATYRARKASAGLADERESAGAVEPKQPGSPDSE